MTGPGGPRGPGGRDPREGRVIHCGGAVPA